MTRRSATSLSFQIRLRLPPGGTTKQALEFIMSALCEHKARMNQQAPLAALDTDSIVVKLQERKTTYL